MLYREESEVKVKKTTASQGVMETAAGDNLEVEAIKTVGEHENTEYEDNIDMFHNKESTAEG